MSARAFLAAALLAVAIQSPALAQQEIPQSLESYKPHEIVEAVISEAGTLGLSNEQVSRLDSLHVSVRDEQHNWTRTPGNKAHRARKMEPMVSQGRAYGDAVAILSTAQRQQLKRTFAAPGYVPRVPSLVTVVPPSLKSLEPDEIVDVFLAEGGRLGLTAQQISDLDTLHVVVRDEPHRYSKEVHGPKGTPHWMMEPMITKRRAYNDALSYLTPDQQDRAARAFRDPAYRAPKKGAANQ